jgi:hypothetical protein
MPDIEITSFGTCFLIVSLIVAATIQNGILVVAVLAATLQAPAVFVVGAGPGQLGVTAFNVAYVFAACGLARELVRHPACVGELLTHGASTSWLPLLAVSALGAIALPMLFDGIGVHPALARGDVARETVPLALSISNVAHAINCMGLLLLFVYGRIACKGRDAATALFRAMMIGLLATVVITLNHRAAIYQLVPLDPDFWGSNPTYNQNFASGFGPYFGRTSLPFIEPSYASIWFASVCAGLLLAALYGHSTRWPLHLGGSLIAALGLLSTLGTSGMAALFAFAVMIVAYHGIRGHAHAPLRTTRILLVLMVATAAGAAVLTADYLIWQIDALAPARAAIYFSALKLSWLADTPRFWSAQRGFELVLETWGLGVGGGSARASSYALSMLANTGVAGTMLFALAWMRDAGRLWVMMIEGSPAACFMLGTGVACLIGVAGAISDLNWPVLWIFLLCGHLVAMPEPTRNNLVAQRQRHLVSNS